MVVLPNGSDAWLQPRYAYTYGHTTVRTRLCSPLGSASLPHDARVLTCLACAHDPIPGAPTVGGLVADMHALMLVNGSAAWLQLRYAHIYSHASFKRAYARPMSRSRCLTMLAY